MERRLVTTGLGNFIVKFVPSQQPIRENVKVLHAGPLELEVVDPVIIQRVYALCIYDLLQELEHGNRT